MTQILSRSEEVPPRGRPRSADPGYSARHLRVYAARGPAADYLCEGLCGGQAYDWATIHDRDGMDVMDYIPMCHRCHFQYDLGGVPQTAEHRAKISAACVGNTKWAGKKHTPETRAKMSTARSAYWARKRGGQDGADPIPE